MQSSRIVPLASAPAGCAVPYSTTHDHCGALKEFSRNISKAALNISPSCCQGFAVRRLCLPSFPRTDSDLAVWECDHLRRPHCALGRSDPTLPLGKPDAPLRVRRSSRIRAHRRDLARPQTQLISANDEFQFARANLSKQSVSNSAAQMLFNRIAQGTRSQSRMKAALHQE
jgi:hypothetical protein